MGKKLQNLEVVLFVFCFYFLTNTSSLIIIKISPFFFTPFPAFTIVWSLPWMHYNYNYNKNKALDYTRGAFPFQKEPQILFSKFCRVQTCFQLLKSTTVPLYWIFKDHLVPEMYDLQIIQKMSRKTINKQIIHWNKKKMESTTITVTPKSNQLCYFFYKTKQKYTHNRTSI